MAKVSFEDWLTNQKYSYNSVDELAEVMLYNSNGIPTPNINTSIWHVRLGSEYLFPGAVATGDLNTSVCTFEELLLVLGIDY